MSALQDLAAKWKSEGKGREAARILASMELGWEVLVAVRKDYPNLSENEALLETTIICNSLVK